jgi:hypothetical protein
MNATDLMIQEFDIPKETIPICTDAQEIENSAEVMVVNSPEGFQSGARALAVIKHTKKKVVNALKEQKSHAYQVHSAICKYETKATEPLDHAEDVVKEKMGEWYMKQKAFESEQIELGEKIVSLIPNAENIGIRENIKVEILDESKIPQRFWSVDKKKLSEFAKSNDGMLEVEGVHFVKGVTIVNNS